MNLLRFLRTKQDGKGEEKEGCPEPCLTDICVSGEGQRAHTRTLYLFVISLTDKNVTICQESVTREIHVFRRNERPILCYISACPFVCSYLFERVTVSGRGQPWSTCACFWNLLGASECRRRRVSRARWPDRARGRAGSPPGHARGSSPRPRCSGRACTRTAQC